MNQFTVLVLLLVVFCYCGGKYCPAVLKQNKQILLGVVGGLVLASFFGLRLEAYKGKDGKEHVSGGINVDSSGNVVSGADQINAECERRDHYCSGNVPTGMRAMWEEMCGGC